MGVFVIDNISDYLRVVVLSGGKILLFKVLSEHVFNKQICAEFAVSDGHIEYLEYLSVSLKDHVRVLGQDLSFGLFTLSLFQQRR